MANPPRVTPNAVLLASGFLLQGILVALGDPGGAVLSLPLFSLLAVWVMVAPRASGLAAFLVGSASLGGLGMAIGRLLDPLDRVGVSVAHHAGTESMASLAPIVSWGGVLMLAGCTAACFLPSTAAPAATAGVRAPTRRPSPQHHLWSLIGMIAGMWVWHSLAGVARVETPGWAMHLTMLAAMLLGGWGALALAMRVARGG